MAGAVDFVEHLRRQLGFLELSCASYDAGHRDEAIRIATTIRVLTHNTKASTSLLKHLNATTMNLLSTTFEPSPQTVSFVGLGMMRIGGGSSEYFPQLGDGPINELVPVQWNRAARPNGRFLIIRELYVGVRKQAKGDPNCRVQWT